MKISGNQDPAAQAQSLLPVALPQGATKTSDGAKIQALSKTDSKSVEPSDHQSFSKLLEAGQSEPSRLSTSKGQSLSSKSSGAAASKRVSLRGDGRSSAPGSAASDLRVTSGSTSSGSAPKSIDRTSVSPSKDAQAGSTVSSGSNLASPSSLKNTLSNSEAQTSQSLDQSQVAGVFLDSSVAPLPADPRLQQDPAEVAIEAAAIVAAQLLAVPQAEAPAQAAAGTESQPPVGEVLVGQFGEGGGQNSIADQASIRSFQASLRPSLGSAAAAPTQGGPVPNPVQSATGLPSPLMGAQTSGEINSGSLAPIVVLQPSLVSASIPRSSDPADFASPVPVLVSQVSVGLNAQTVSLSVSSDQLAQLALAGENRAQAAASISPSDLQGPSGAVEQPLLGLSQSLPTLAQARVQGQPDLTAQVAGAAAAESVAAQVVPSDTVAVEDQSGIVRLKSDQSAAANQSVQNAPLQSAVVNGASGKNPADSSAGENSKERQAAAQAPSVERTSGRMGAPSSRPVSSPPKSDVQAGTLGANNGSVQHESAPVRLSEEQSFPVQTQEGSGAPVVGKPVSGAVSPSGILSLDNQRPAQEVASKPVLLPPAQVKANEVWKVVSDAIQRARSENPSHLAVEVRLDDGSTLGLEVRMSSTGLHASFRSESQTLLKTLETQWAGFVSKEPTDSKVTSAVFEGRTGFGSSTDSNGNAGERRQQMEDSSASGSLSRGGTSQKPGASKPGGPVQITPSIRTRDGRVAVYA